MAVGIREGAREQDVLADRAAQAADRAAAVEHAAELNHLSERQGQVRGDCPPVKVSRRSPKIACRSIRPDRL